MSEHVTEAPPEQTAPGFAWEIVVNSGAWFFQRLPGGGMAIKFVPAAVTPNGTEMTAPAFVIPFSDDAWRTFQEEVAMGEKKPQIATALHLPARPNGDLGRRR